MVRFMVSLPYLAAVVVGLTGVPVAGFSSSFCARQDSISATKI
jgi:hypothetical protein